MRFQVAYGSGTRHEVQLARTLVVLGRDPTCDLVLNDSRCSRRHAVIEDRPEGLLIRDCGSANGIRVNEARVHTAILRPGDTVRLGDVTVTVMVEVGETVVVAPPDLEPLTMPATGGPLVDAAAAPAAPRPAATPRPSPPPAPARPLTVNLLVAVWALATPASIAAALWTAARLDAGPVGWAAAAAVSLLFATLGVVMVLGLASLAPWARQLQIAVAALGMLACPFALAWATVLLYLARPEVKAAFDRRSPGPAASGAAGAEPTFALSILAMLLLGALLTAAAVLVLLRPAR
ncbi:MAG TPA: FHA domain-containing protein [Vicinamibacteria bacterium]|nr:FHA domain-containing protein [Vicinamibacteria bacterium]